MKCDTAGRPVALLQRVAARCVAAHSITCVFQGVRYHSAMLQFEFGGGTKICARWPVAIEHLPDVAGPYATGRPAAGNRAAPPSKPSAPIHAVASLGERLNLLERAAPPAARVTIERTELPPAATESQLRPQTLREPNNV